MRRRFDEVGPEEEGGFFPVDLTPMIDIVFLLLIFFMVSTRFLDAHGYDVELPETEDAPRQEGVTETPVIVVGADGIATIDGERFEPGDPIPMAEAWSRAVVRADRRASHGDVMGWMDRLQGKGVTAVTLESTPLEKRPPP